MFSIFSITYRSDAEWKRTRNAASKQVVPRRVGNFVTPMCDIADNFITHLEGVMEEDGNISNIPPEVPKWMFQSNDIRIEVTSLL